MITSHGMASFSSLSTQCIGLTIRENVEIDAAGVVIEEPAVVEGRTFPCVAEVFRLVVIDTSHDVISQNPLFLLPPGFSVVPDTTVMLFPILQGPFHHVVPSTALVITTCAWNCISNLVSERLVALLGHQAVHPGEVPSNFEVVTHNAPCLMNPPLQVMGPVFIELLVHERAVAIIREMLANRVESIFEKRSVVLISSR